MLFNYKKFTDPQKVSKNLSRAFIYSFQIDEFEEIESKSVKDLRQILAQSELTRRPNKNFTLVIAVEEDFDFEPYIRVSDFEKSSYISKKSVETLKKYNKKPEYQHRCLIISLKFLEKFLKSDFECSGPFIKTFFELTQEPENAFELFCPLLLLKEKYLKVTSLGLKKLKPLPRLIEKALFEKKSTSATPSLGEQEPQAPLPHFFPVSQPEPQTQHEITEPEPVVSQQVESQQDIATPEVVIATQQDTMASSENPEKNNILNLEHMSRKGYKENVQFSLKSLWDPDNKEESGSFEEISKILRYVYKRNQFQNAEALILSFLSQNSQQKIILELNEKQQTNLDDFLEWLKGYRREERWQILAKFQRLKQGKLCFKSYASQLKKLYREANEISSDDKINQLQWDEIKRVFVKNLTDKRIRNNIRLIITKSSLNELIKACENVEADLADESEDDSSMIPVTSKVNNISQNDELINALKTFKSNQERSINELKEQFRKSEDRLNKMSENFASNNGHYSQPQYNSRQNFEPQYPSRPSFESQYHSRPSFEPQFNSRPPFENQYNPRPPFDPRYNSRPPFDSYPRNDQDRSFCAKCRTYSHSNSECVQAHKNETVNGRPFCRYCKKDTHTIRDCFKAASRDRGRARENFQDRSRQNERRSGIANVVTTELSAKDIFSEN